MLGICVDMPLPCPEVCWERDTVNVDINTKMITLIGTPLGQSFAARMQNAGYAAAGINMLYFYTEADSAHLGEIIDGVRHMPSFAGCAVTKPNKVKVLRYLDGLDPLCEKMGACNTVVKTPEGKLIGYNTDGMGFLRSITEEAGFNVAGARIFCFGAGGAGRAICSILAHSGAGKVYITDLDAESGAALVKDINENFAPVAEFVAGGDYSKIAGCDLVINATGLGMGESIGRSPLPVEYIAPGQFYYDTCYNPARTQFLMDAEARGCRVMNGLGMSLYQGVVQIELWTGREAPVEAMRRELMDILAEQE